MPFGVKIGPPTYQRVMNKDFKEYLNKLFKKYSPMILQFTVTWTIICLN
jgi:hypothetical protein